LSGLFLFTTVIYRRTYPVFPTLSLPKDLPYRIFISTLFLLTDASAILMD